MDITVAGPGAGKTTNLARRIILHDRVKNKRVFVITFTNSAKAIISTELSKSSASSLRNVSVSTIHSFLLSEVIFPYHHFLYDELLTKAISKDLPNEPAYRQKQLSDLRKKGVVDNSEVFKLAKYIICGKSSDKKEQKLVRQKILQILSSYISNIFIDEAQDIDEDIVSILEAFDANGIQIYLIGDPKQDIRASHAFYKLVKKVRPQYISENHRCPKRLVEFMNLFVEKEELQVSQSKLVGELEYIFGDVADLNKVMQEHWDLAYIVEKNNEFMTIKNQSNSSHMFNTLAEIIEELGDRNWEKSAFVMLSELKRKNVSEASMLIAMLQTKYRKNLSKKQMSKIYKLDFCSTKGKVDSRGPFFYISSIDNAKGEEGERCLFVFTTDFIKYLYDPKLEMNKTKSRLYVALSRSKRKLTILLNKQVISKIGKEELKALLEPHGFEDVTNDYI